MSVIEKQVTLTLKTCLYIPGKSITVTTRKKQLDLNADDYITILCDRIYENLELPAVLILTLF